MSDQYLMADISALVLSHSHRKTQDRQVLIRSAISEQNIDGVSNDNTCVKDKRHDAHRASCCYVGQLGQFGKRTAETECGCLHTLA